MVDLVKSNLRKMLGRSKPTFEKMRTIVAEVEAVLNVPSVDKGLVKRQRKGCSDPLASHVWKTDHHSFLRPDCGHHQRPLLRADSCPLKRIKHSTVEDHGYISEVLPPRLPHQSSGISSIGVKLFQVGDLVLVNDDDDSERRPRPRWPMAVVGRLIVSRDGKVRAADIRTVNGKTNRDSGV